MMPEQLSALFNEGAGNGPPVAGDRAREAVASLRGYAYQVYATALEWVELAPGAELHLEVAEDFAVAAADALRAVQVKNQAGSVTLASQTVRDALDAYVSLVAANPARTVHLMFLTTATIGLERSVAHRPRGDQGLVHWRDVACGADLDELRRVLLGLDLAEATKKYIHERDDERLRRELVQRIEWRCGEAPLGDLNDRLRKRVAGLCADELDIPLEEGDLVVPHLLLRVLRTSTSPDTRVLRHADLRAVAEDARRVSIPRRVLELAFRNLMGTGTQDAGRGSWHQDAPEREEELPLPVLVVPRPALVEAVASALAR